MSLIDEVARLKELAKREASATYIQAGDEFGYECAVLNDMPDLLEVLSGFREGDANRLHGMVEAMDIGKSIWPEDGEFDSDRELLVRYRGMAQAMEATR